MKNGFESLLHESFLRYFIMFFKDEL